MLAIANGKCRDRRAAGPLMLTFVGSGIRTRTPSSRLLERSLALAIRHYPHLPRFSRSVPAIVGFLDKPWRPDCIRRHLWFAGTQLFGDLVKAHRYHCQ